MQRNPLCMFVCISCTFMLLVNAVTPENSSLKTRLRKLLQELKNRGDSSPSALISTVTKSALPAPPEVEKRSGGADDLDLRRHNLFKSWPQLECCPTITEKVARHSGINQQGLVLELFNSPAFNQTFYETHCHPEIRGRACQFIDGRIARASRCTQQHTYVYAVGRPYGRRQLQFRFDYIRIASGCKCLLDKKALWMMKN